MKEAQQARDRLAFEELLLLQTVVLEQRTAKGKPRRTRALAPPAGLAADYLARLPYTPTRAQTRVIGEIEGDLARTVPMRRLLHGDVGSGKTMVAGYCLLRAVEQGGQGALMAPTEVLADQHYLGLSEQLRPAMRTSWWARMLSSSRGCVFTTCGWRSSTSSTGSA
jgi:ATP-dependent DNA helicase RecG